MCSTSSFRSGAGPSPADRRPPPSPSPGSLPRPRTMRGRCAPMREGIGHEVLRGWPSGGTPPHRRISGSDDSTNLLGDGRGFDVISSESESLI